MKDVLYISYDGLLDPLGYSQIQPYLRVLADSGVALRVLSFEKPGACDSAELERVRDDLEGRGIHWRRLRYHKRPAVAATLWDICAGFCLGARELLRGGIGIIHARSYIAATIALGLCSLSRVSFLFDMRGFWADERVEGGLWPAGGILYRTFKWLERRFLARADGVVVLSRRGAEVLKDMLPGGKRQPRLEVIPTCVDLELFRPGPPLERPCDRLRLVYVGSLGTWYMVREMVDFFGTVYSSLPESTFTVLTPAGRDQFDRALEGLRLPPGARERITLKSLPYRRVPEALAQADCLIFFIRPTFSKQASCATKFAESLACGVPLVINSGIGDHDHQLRLHRAGVVLKNLERESYLPALEELLELLAEPGLKERCRRAAESDFSLEQAGRSYLSLYRGMAGEQGAG